MAPGVQGERYNFGRGPVALPLERARRLVAQAAQGT
jgi:hypothetical protein